MSILKAIRPATPTPTSRQSNTVMDNYFIYLMVETYGVPVKPDAVFEIDFDYQTDDTNFPGHSTDLHTNIGDGYFNAWIDTNGDGEIEPYTISVQGVAVGDVLEVRIPRSELGNPKYFNVLKGEYLGLRFH